MNKLCLALGWISLCGVLGCGTHAAHVSGLVTLDGKPLAIGVVTFHATAQTGSVAVGQIQSDGKYQLSIGTETGIPPGDYVITVVASEPVAASQPGEEGGYRAITPAQYASGATSGWKVTLKPGSQTIPLEMHSSGNKR